jgi:hypothetical protein
MWPSDTAVLPCDTTRDGGEWDASGASPRRVGLARPELSQLCPPPDITPVHGWLLLAEPGGARLLRRGRRWVSQALFRPWSGPIRLGCFSNTTSTVGVTLRVLAVGGSDPAALGNSPRTPSPARSIAKRNLVLFNVRNVSYDCQAARAVTGRERVQQEDNASGASTTDSEITVCPGNRHHQPGNASTQDPERRPVSHGRRCPGAARPQPLRLPMWLDSSYRGREPTCIRHGRRLGIETKGEKTVVAQMTGESSVPGVRMPPAL